MPFDRVTYQDVLKEWQKGRFKSVYLFSGTETLLKNEAVDTLAGLFLGAENQDVNWDRFDGKTAQAMDVATVWQTRAFFGGRRLVTLRQVEDMSKPEMMKLAEAIYENDSPNCLVLLWNEKPDPRHVLTQAAQKKGEAIPFWVPFESQMPRWVQDRVRAKGKTISVGAVQVLLESAGLEPQSLAPEIEKLVLYINDRPRIEASDVEALNPGGRATSYLDIDRALWKRDRAAALKCWAQHWEQDQPAEVFLSQLGRVYKRLMQGKAMLHEEGEPTPRLWETVRIRTRDLQAEFTDGLRAWNWDGLLAALKQVLAAERNIKNGRMEAPLAMTLLICDLTQMQESREPVALP